MRQSADTGSWEEEHEAEQVRAQRETRAREEEPRAMPVFYPFINSRSRGLYEEFALG